MQPELILTPFGESANPGTINDIPESLNPSDPVQSASWQAGFPLVTMTPLSAGGIPPRGQDVNGALRAISRHSAFLGGGGQYKWSAAYVAAKGGYSIGDVIQANDGLNSYVSLVSSNSVDFNATPSSIGTSWQIYSGTGLIQKAATETSAGIAPIATTPLAVAGTDDSRIMTPLKVAQSIASRLPVQATEAVAGIAAIATQGDMASQNNDTKIVTPQKLTSWFNTKVATYIAAGIAAFANAAEVNAGTVENKTVNPATLRFGFQVLKSPTGYIKFPDWLGGLVVQWTKTPTLNTSTAYVWNYPIRFPNTVVGTFGMFIGLSQGTLEVTESPGLTSASFANGLSGSTPGPAFVFAWGF